jgi:hypothetical protein
MPYMGAFRAVARDTAAPFLIYNFQELGGQVPRRKARAPCLLTLVYACTGMFLRPS